MNRVGIVVLGASGYMGSQGLAALCSIEQKLRDQGIQIELLTLVDPLLFNEEEDVATQARRKARDFMGKLGSCGMEMTSRLALEDLAYKRTKRVDLPERIIFYDATSTRFHSNNLSLVQTYGDLGFVYFGEKPLFNDIMSMKSMASTRYAPDYYCDFIEIENPVIQSVKKYIDQSGLILDDLKFWRSGSSGLKHIVGHDQSGIEGGAWLDKAAHDLAIAYSILQPDFVVGFGLRKAEFLELIPYPGEDIGFLKAYGFDVPIPGTELNFDVRSPGGSRLGLPADGLTRANFTLKLRSSRRVALSVLAGWTGCHGLDGEKYETPAEREFTQILGSLGVARNEWLFSERFNGRHDDGQRSCLESQARIMLLRGHLGDREFLVAANLVHSDADVLKERSALDRWARVYEKKEGAFRLVAELEFDLAPTYDQQKTRDLSRIFERVIKSVATRSQDDGLSRDAVNLVHRMLLSAHDRAISGAKANGVKDQDGSNSSAGRVARAVRTND